MRDGRYTQPADPGRSDPLQLEAKARRTCIDGTVIEADKVDVRVLGADEGAGRIVICK